MKLSMNKPNTRLTGAAVAVCGIGLILCRIAVADPSLGGPVLGVKPSLAQLNLINCDDTNFLYVVQTSTNLQDWKSVQTNSAAPSGSTIYAFATNTSCFYRLMVISNVPQPLFNYAILTRSNINLNGNNVIIDSFDSSNPLYSTQGQYDPAKRKAGGDIATVSSVVGDINVGNANIFGSIFTGPGTVEFAVQIGSGGVVGDIAWNSGNQGIEPGHWAGDLIVNLPDVQTPTFSGDALPAPVSGVITLNGGFYTSPTNPAAAFNITGPTTLWIQGTFSPGNIAIATTNSASLVVYVGTAGNSVDTLNLANTTNGMNLPGFATNLQFYGLPSVSNIMFSATRGFVGSVYAPGADATISGGGTNQSLVCGALIVKSITMNSHPNLHFDENLRVAGPTR